MSKFAQVTVKNNRYIFSGDFHHICPNQPIRDLDNNGRLTGITNPRDMTYVHSYGGEAVFFENLSRGKIHGSRCDNPECEFTGTVYLPFRIHCPDCLAKNTVIDLTDICKTSARIHTFMVCERSGAFNTLAKPMKFINIEFDGVATILMSYLSVGEPRIGMRVKPIFKTTDPTYTILDLSWVPEDTQKNQLPPGFSFG
ncbi:MAG: hypothetical protein B5M56_06835 [Desulfococcus sp. 4484_241]|nr:MAG: hypothetical protein B5M56_06835 [Desulfococcus sp. 4484_241]